MGKWAWIRAATVVAATFVVGGVAPAASVANTTPAVSSTSFTGAERCYQHVLTTRHFNLSGTMTRSVAGGARVCVRGSKTLSKTKVTECISSFWKCTVRTTIHPLAGKPHTWSVFTVAKFSRKVNGATRTHTMAGCFHFRVTTGDVRVPCRLHPTTLSSGDEECNSHIVTTYHFNRGLLRRWVKGGIKQWCVLAGKTVSMTSIADCGSPKHRWSCNAVTDITPLTGHSQQRRSFTLASFTRMIGNLLARRGMTVCFHLRENSTTRSFCRIDHA